MPQPLVSIILLSALRMKCTQKCIESIFHHTSGVNFEIIIVDMGKDKVLEEWLLKQEELHSNLKVIYNTDNVGTSKGRNQAIKQARGSYIVFLDNDAQVTNSWLKNLLESSYRWPKAGLFGAKLICPNGYIYFCNKYIYDEVINGIHRIGIKITDNLYNDDPVINQEVEVPWYPTGCLMVRKKTLEAIGGFDEDLMFVEEDKDLCLRAKSLGNSIIYCPASVVIHDRVHDEKYDKLVRFGNILRVKEDIKYFELKWQRKVDLIYSRQCLENLGYSEEFIDSIVSGPLGGIFTLSRNP